MNSVSFTPPINFGTQAPISLARLPSDVRYAIVNSLVPSDITASRDNAWYVDLKAYEESIDSDVLNDLVANDPALARDSQALGQHTVFWMATDILWQQAQQLPVHQDGRTVLMAVALLGDPDLITHLLNPYVNQAGNAWICPLPDQLMVNAADCEGRTALMHAAGSGYPHIIEALAAYGALTNQVDGNGWSALHHAASRGDTDSIDVLRRLDANMYLHNARGETALQLAIQHNQIPAIRTLVPHHAELFDDRPVADSFLHRAAREGNALVVNTLLGLNVSPHIKTFDHGTPMHAAAAANQSECLDALCHAGGNLDAADIMGMTPLHIATEEGNIEAVMFLIGAGANLHARDNDNDTAVDIAVNNGDAEIAVLLEDAMRRQLDGRT
jgi:ankyrin repeat protein